jgi:hypothetical protein
VASSMTTFMSSKLVSEFSRCDQSLCKEEMRHWAGSWLVGTSQEMGVIIGFFAELGQCG